MPFEDDYVDLKKTAKPTKGLKLDNKNSFLADKPQNNIEEQVQEIEENKQKYKKEAAKLALKYKNLLDDKTLVQNKNALNNMMEADVLKEIADLAMRINNDPNEKEGMGSLSWIILNLKCLLLMRDKVNQMEYKLSLIEKKLEDLPKWIEKAVEAKSKKND